MTTKFCTCPIKYIYCGECGGQHRLANAPRQASACRAVSEKSSYRKAGPCQVKRDVRTAIIGSRAVALCANHRAALQRNGRVLVQERVGVLTITNDRRRE